MKFILKSLLLITLMNTLLSLQFRASEKDLIGSWRVKTVINSSGKRKDGDKIISFYSDKTIVTEDIESDRTRNGIWRFDTETNVIYIQKSEEESWEAIDVVKLTKKQLVVKEGGKTIKCVRVTSEQKE